MACPPFRTILAGMAAGYWAVAGCWLLVAGCWLLVAGCWLLVAGCWLLVAGCWLLVAGQRRLQLPAPSHQQLATVISSPGDTCTPRPAHEAPRTHLTVVAIHRAPFRPTPFCAP